MSASVIRFSANSRVLPFKRFFSQKPSSGAPASKAKKPDGVNANVPRLSSYVLKPNPAKLAPGVSASGTYKSPEYFSYDRLSYHGAEVELAKYRCPQPSAKAKN